MSSFLHFLYTQLILSLPYPKQSFAGKTVIVTGSNVGLGKEAARHVARLGASTVILAVRSLEKGEDAKRDIEQSTGCNKDVVQVWQLDLASFQSVKDFAARAKKELSRVDVLLENAGIATRTYSLAEDNERTITVNVVSTFLLAFLMFPKLKETAQKFNSRPVLTIITSGVHAWTDLPEKSAANGQIFKTLNDKETANMAIRYPVSKLLEVLVVREIAEKAPSKSFPITVNCVDPGFCHS
jgi:NAD(P)-dependent dehydrogenase (short-subunit alcohol dehydrogenase family)